MAKSSCKTVLSKTAIPNKPVSSSISCGGFGIDFEHRVQAFFAILMLCEGELAFARSSTIQRMQLQVRTKGYHTDDVRLELIDKTTEGVSQVLIQIKSNIKVSEKNDDFVETILAAWKDYNNAQLFNRESDYLVLATGPLRDKDYADLEWVVVNAGYKESTAYVDEIEHSTGISTGKSEIFNTIYNIVTSYSDSATKQDVASFLSRFRLLQTDARFGKGLTESFVISLLKKSFPNCETYKIFSLIKDFISERNPFSSDITKDILEKQLDVKGAALSCNVVSSTKSVDRAIDSSKIRRDHLALLSLVGSWCENDTDSDIVSNVIGLDRRSFDDLKAALSQSEPPLLIIESGIARVSRRRSIWRASASKVTLDELRRFFAQVKVVLCKLDKSLDKEVEDRYMVSYDERGLGASKVLREGLASGAALCSSDISYCRQISSDYKIRFARVLMSGLFENSDWKLWATLDDLLPYLAEVSPDLYLKAVRNFVARKRNGLSVLYAQEKRGVMGRTYIYGLVNSLAVLAWIPEYMPSAMSIVGELASRDPDGQWQPRPIDIFQKVFHPLGPHTWVKSDRRVSVLGGLLKKLDKDIAWSVIRRLLPAEFYSYIKDAVAPVYLSKGRSVEVESGREDKVVWREFDKYCFMAVEIAERRKGQDLEHLVSSAIDRWNDPSFKRLVKCLECGVKKFAKEARYRIWLSLLEEVKHLRAKDGGGAKINWQHYRPVSYLKLVDIYKPKDIRLSGRRLFSWMVHCEMEKDVLKEKQQEAVRNVYNKFGLDGVVQFASHVDNSGEVGYALSSLGDCSLDAEVLPAYLCSTSGDVRNVVTRYVQGRLESQTWNWVDTLNITDWSKDRVVDFLLCLPFNQETWRKSEALLRDDVCKYWKAVTNPCAENSTDAVAAAEAFLSVGCCCKALDVLGYYMREGVGVPVELVVKVLQAFSMRAEDEPSSSTGYNIRDAIKVVQADKTLDVATKSEIEWLFIDCLGGRGYGAIRPATLEMQLASDPKLFVQALELVYRSEADVKAKRKQTPLSEATERRTASVWSLLYNWSVVPGMTSDGKFDSKRFKSWLKQAQSLAKASNRLKPMKIALSQVFIHAIDENAEFWLPREIADLMEKKGNETMLSHFRIALYNSRGVHHVDRTGAEDEALASRYDKMAESAECAGYFSLANEMRVLAASVRGDFKRMQEEDNALDAYFEAKRGERNEDLSLPISPI